MELTRNEIFAGVSKTDREAFLKVLKHIHANACALDEATTTVAAQPQPTAARLRTRLAQR
jgi:hypothetical protein